MTLTASATIHRILYDVTLNIITQYYIAFELKLLRNTKIKQRNLLFLLAVLLAPLALEQAGGELLFFLFGARDSFHISNLIFIQTLRIESMGVLFNYFHCKIVDFYAVSRSHITSLHVRSIFCMLNMPRLFSYK